MSAKNTDNKATEEKELKNEVVTEDNKEKKSTDKKGKKTESKAKKSEKAKKTTAKKDKNKEKIEELEAKVAEQDDKYLRLAAEYDNYRRRTLKEKSEMLKSAGQNILIDILPVIDNFDRAMASMENNDDAKAVKEGIELIYTNFTSFLTQKGIKEIDAKEKEFNTEEHEAITKIPAPTPELKGKNVDVITKGYKLNDKVIRFAQVVVGE